MTQDAPRDTVVPLSRFRAALARPRGVRRIEALLSAQNPAEAVGGLSVLELHELVSEVGLADSYELLALATGEQVRGCLDIEIWERDELDVSRAVPWLRAALAAGYERFGEIWATLDTELAALLITRLARVYDTTLEEAPPEDSQAPVYKTPDTFFCVELTTEDEDDAQLALELLESLYRADPELARHTLLCARSEPTTELAEMSYRWRAGRMADLGYVDYYEALAVFRPLPVEHVQIGEGTAEPADPALEGDEARAPRALPALLLDVAVGREFLARTLDRITDAAEASRIEAALVLLVNKVLSASRVRPGDPEARAAGTQHATSTLALGLELVSGSDPDLATEALRTISLTRLHRVGHTATLPLARLARALAPRAQAAGDADAALLGALLGARPWYPVCLDEPGAHGIRPFESRADVRRAAEAVTRLALRVAAADALGASLLEAGEGGDHPELDDHIRTALARVVAGGALSAAPLAPAEIEALVRSARGGQFPDEAKDRAKGAFTDHLRAAQVSAGMEYVPDLMAAWLSELEATFSPLSDTEDVDPAMLAGVVCAPREG